MWKLLGCLRTSGAHVWHNIVSVRQHACARDMASSHSASGLLTSCCLHPNKFTDKDKDRTKKRSEFPKLPRDIIEVLGRTIHSCLSSWRALVMKGVCNRTPEEAQRLQENSLMVFLSLVKIITKILNIKQNVPANATVLRNRLHCRNPAELVQNLLLIRNSYLHFRIL